MQMLQFPNHRVMQTTTLHQCPRIITGRWADSVHEEFVISINLYTAKGVGIKCLQQVNYLTRKAATG